MLNYNRSIIKSWIVSYSLILIIPFFIWLGLYCYTKNVLTDNSVEMNEMLIEASVNRIEESVNQINQNNIQLSMNSFIENIKYMDKNAGAEEYYKYAQFSKELGHVKLSYSIIDNVYVYVPALEHCFIGRGNMSERDFFDYYYADNDIEFEQWKKSLIECKGMYQESQHVRGTTDKYEDVIAFIQPLPMGIKDRTAVCVTIVKKEKLFELLQSESKKPSTAFVAVNGNNTLLDTVGNASAVEELKNITSSGKFNVCGKKQYVVRKDIKSIGWTFFAMTSVKDILSGFYVMRLISAILFCGYILLSGILIIAMLRRNYAPIRNLIERIASKLNIQYENSTNEYTWIEKALKETIEKSSDAMTLVDKQNNHIRTKLINDLLEDRIKSSITYEDAMQGLGIRFVGNRFLVILFRIEEPETVFSDTDDMSEVNRRRNGNFIINNIASELIGANHYTISTYIRDEAAVIVNIKDGIDGESCLKNIHDAIDKTKETVWQYFGFVFVTAMSNIHSTPRGIPQAYSEAREALEYRVLHGSDAVIQYGDIDKGETIQYYYPIEAEIKLINCIKAGKEMEARRIVDDICESNFRNKKLPLMFVKCLMCDIMSTLIKVVLDISPEENSGFDISINKLLECSNIYEMKENINAILEDVCRYVTSQNSSDLTSRVKAYISENYSDSQLSVASVAESIGFTPTYMSAAFKSETGHGVLEYIMQYRVETAKRKNAEMPDCTIEEISRQVGYDNMRTFIRIFRKYEGVTPLQYRNSNT